MKAATLASTTDDLRLFEVASTVSSVDADRGVIYGVSLITSGLLAKGHSVPDPLDKDKRYDLEVDATTLTQMLSCAEAKKKVPVKWNHKTGADAVSGYLKNFRIEGKKLVGDWHLLKSHERYQHALELAAEMPECLGLSTSFKGKDVIIGERAFARCTDLVSADLVASPAANPDGFFEEVDSTAGDMAKPSTAAGATLESEKEFSLADVMAGLNSLAQRLDQSDARQTSFEENHNALIEQLNSFEELEEEEVEDEPGREFANGAEAIQYLSEKLSHIEDAAEQARVDHAFEVYESKVESLMELNERLAMENAVMAEAIHEFTEKTGSVIEFSAGAEGDGYTHTLSTPDDDRAAPRNEFEARVRHFENEGKDIHEATRSAITENKARYQKHLQAIGVMAREL